MLYYKPLKEMVLLWKFFTGNEVSELEAGPDSTSREKLKSQCWVLN